MCGLSLTILNGPTVRDPSHACGGFVLKVFSRPAPTPYGVETWRDVGWELGSLVEHAAADETHLFWNE